MQIKTLSRLSKLIESRGELSPIDKMREAIRADGDNVVYKRGTTNFDIRDRLDSVESCSTEIQEIKVEYMDLASGMPQAEDQVISVHACNDSFFCPVCAKRRADARFFAVKDAMIDAQQQGALLYHLTFTIKDSDNPYEMYDGLSRSIRRFMLTGQKGRIGEWEKVEGFYLNFEAKRGSGSGLFHIHAHAVVACSQRLNYVVFDPVKMAAKMKELGPVEVAARRAAKKAGERRTILSEEELDEVKKDGGFSKLSREWKRACDLSGVVGHSIHAQLLFREKEKDSTGKETPASETKNAERMLREVCKYPAKMADFINDFDASRIAELYDSMKARRNFRSGGIFSAASRSEFNLRRILLSPGADIKPMDRPEATIVGYSEYRHRSDEFDCEAGWDIYDAHSIVEDVAEDITSGKRKQRSVLGGRLLAEYRGLRHFVNTGLHNVAAFKFVSICKHAKAEFRRLRKISQAEYLDTREALISSVHNYICSILGVNRFFWLNPKCEQMALNF